MTSLSEKIENKIFYRGKYYTINDIKVLKKKWEGEYFELPKHHKVDKYALNSLELTEEQLNNLDKLILKQKASSWKSRQRKLRREGKLDQYKIDALNNLGMLWNPQDDLWEIKFSYFSRFGLCEPIEKWVHEQRELYKNGNLTYENFIRLKSINFPFLKKKGEVFNLDYAQILLMEEQLLLGKKNFEDDYSMEKFINKKSKKRKSIIRPEDKKLSKTQKGKLYELNLLSTEEHIVEIDKLFNKEYKLERVSGVIKSKQQHYSEIYSESLEYLKGVFYTGKIKNNSKETVRFKYTDSVVVYASEKALCHLDEFMLSSGKYNDYTKFPPVEKLINYYCKNKQVGNLNRINNIVLKHSVLKAIYSKRINKLIFKINKQ